MPEVIKGEDTLRDTKENGNCNCFITSAYPRDKLLWVKFAKLFKETTKTQTTTPPNTAEEKWGVWGPQTSTCN